MFHVKRHWQKAIPLLESLWYKMIRNPYHWIFLCFFQPSRFRTTFEHVGFFQRVSIMFQLTILLFLISLVIALPIPLLFSHFSLTILYSITQATLFGVVCGLIIGILGDVGLGIIIALALGITGLTPGNDSIAFMRGITIAISLGLVTGNGRGFQWGILPGLVGGILCGLSWTLLSLFSEVTATGTIDSSLDIRICISLAFVFTGSYIIGYYRIPLYPVGSLLWVRASLAGKKNPAGIFGYLHKSPLYWDECIFLPLPNLRQTLLVAAGQDIQQTLKEIAFVIDYRSQQRQAALLASIEIALRDMERRETIRDIAQASQRLTEILPAQIRLLAPELMKPFNRLDEASREAARYQGPLNWHMRRAALAEVIACLDKIYTDTAFLDAHLTTLLKNTIHVWRRATLYQQEKLEQGAEEVGQLLNPYSPGSTQNDTPFVGRDDMVRQLSTSLSKPNRPTFLLHGERRMGKSSLLKRLPTLLGASYIPVFCDLQNPGFFSSIDVFLEKLAGQIYQEVNFRGVNIEKIELARLQDAFKKNEAAIYHPFDAWLDTVEEVLQREQRTVLLLFDEFEKLEEADEAQHLKLNLLLDWLRNTIQNRSHISLLFSGVRTFGEMGTNWAGYFVNAKMLKMSFLPPTEARHLVTQPIPNFPSQEIFGEGVVEEILRITGYHPFLIQAVCSELIDNLNLENRQQAELQDVTTAVLNVFNAWSAYFQDLWQRTDLQQRICLNLLSKLEERNIDCLAQQSELNEQAVQQILQALLKRDLVRLDEDGYRVAVPLFERWLSTASS